MVHCIVCECRGNDGKLCVLDAHHTHAFYQSDTHTHTYRFRRESAREVMFNLLLNFRNNNKDNDNELYRSLSHTMRARY